MTTTKTTFRKCTVGYNVKYVCKCGYKFVRKNTDHYYNNGFHNVSDTIVKLRDECMSRKRHCPKCKKECTPEKNS